jgi:hypothetical protein
MPDLNDLVSSIFSGGNLEAISQHLGVSHEETASGIAAVLPALVGALAGNASTQRGEQALATVVDRDHDGSLLDSLGGMLAGSLGGNKANGPGILGHLFGDESNQNDMVNTLAGRSGVSSTMISKMMPILAPLVMAWLGKQMRAKVSGDTNQAAPAGGVLGGGGLGGLLGGVLGQMMGGSNQGASAGGGGGLAQILGGLLGGIGQQAPAQPAPQAKGPNLGSILGSIFGK